MAGQREVAQDFGDRVAAVQDVEMDAGHTGVPQTLGLAGGVFGSHLAGPFVVFRVFHQFRFEVGGNLGAAQGGETANLGSAQHWQQTGDDGDVDSRSLGAVDKFEIVVVVVEELGN